MVVHIKLEPKGMIGSQVCRKDSLQALWNNSIIASVFVDVFCEHRGPVVFVTSSPHRCAFKAKRHTVPSRTETGRQSGG
eukprot:6385975-Prymnesium_polylepis.1